MFNSNWLKRDRHALTIIDTNEDISYNLDAIEREIERICSVFEVDKDSLALDTDDFIISNALIEYATLYGLYDLFGSFWGSRSGNNDIYLEKSKMYYQRAQDAYKNLSVQTITADGSEDSDGNPLGVEAYAEFKPLIL